MARGPTRLEACHRRHHCAQLYAQNRIPSTITVAPFLCTNGSCASRLSAHAQANGTAPAMKLACRLCKPYMQFNLEVMRITSAQGPPSY